MAGTNSSANNTPPPMRLVFLSDLYRMDAWTKVRFLGYVDDYKVPSASLVLKHHYPAEQPHVTVYVDVEHILGCLTHAEVQVGAWLNVWGYIMPKLATRGGRKITKNAERVVRVQAAYVNSADGVDVGMYERRLQKLKDTGF
ncbi:CST complex subunit Ten1 [Lineolata rhizophorae]|uniref:CST complex subunit Ten1 n=1 Tax=Lineolata rhizophorae TaxID=578093 RepID=A0A6A6P3P0_9PEZI|nr:CST complex subunit Ten1 [Lineolata rhizophorae]